jgi:alkyldihydroxyacetonephosphate synthase
MTAVAAVPPPLRWWGWGDRAAEVPAGLIALLRDEVAIGGEVVSRPVDIESVALPESALPEDVLHRFAEIVGAVNVRTDREERVRHAAGRSYLDLVALRTGRPAAAPDAVLHPATQAEVAAVLRCCEDAGCAVVPFGGGTSVVGGVSPMRGSHAAVVAVDCDRLDSLVDVDSVSQTATLQAGMRGPRAEGELAWRGLTLGHFPQSFEYATIGGFAATRSAGQASTGYGRFDEMARGLRLTTPTGQLEVASPPATAAGPSLLQLVLGSEGTLGVITDVTVRVRSRPAVRRYAGWSFPDFASGVDALRELAQQRWLPDVARLSDEAETRASFAMAGDSKTVAAARSYLRVRGQPAGCIVIFGWEGDGSSVGTRMRFATPTLRRHGAVALGRAPARSWLRGRFAGPYLRDALLDRAVLVETLETAAEWSKLMAVRDRTADAIRAALEARGTPALVGCHVSHVYPDGASLYFTVLARQESGREVEQWRAAKTAATDALIAAGGTLTHHHGVGVDHAPWLGREVGETGMRGLRALRASLDPAGIMNPGKLVT